MTTAPLNTDYRLPRSVRPIRYNLFLSPDLESATFHGEETIDLEVSESTHDIIMNAIELDITRASVRRAGSTEITDLTISLDPTLERVTFTAAGAIEPGAVQIDIAFNGTLNDKLHGFYRSTFTDDDGVVHTIATTQFEETDARRAFPCFDEPDRKARFSVTLEVAESMAAISNGPELSSSPVGEGRRRVTFGETIEMSTYLVAFVVGPLVATDPVDAAGTPVRVYTVPGKLHLARHALEAGVHALSFFTEYFDIAYPAEKLDLLALPDFAAGAMENLGCVTFREAILLADPDNASRSELERLAEVVEHEIAHMWFGDLVTMRWWNGIWLNEAFATFMALCAQDDYHPDWESFVSFSRSKAAAFQVDSLHATRPIEIEVNHPDEAAAMFDVLTYEKGASVLWMIEQFLGRERFRSGVRRYLRAHLYGNTETGDLWDAIEAEAGDVPIRAIMDSWIFQGGFPLVVATQEGAQLTLAQRPFSYLPRASRPDSKIGSSWLIPIAMRAIDATDERRLVLGSEPASVTVTAAPVLANAGGTGFYRVLYDDATYATILTRLVELTAVERFGFIADTWALIVAGASDLGRLYELAEAMAEERDPHVWSILIGAIGLLDLTARDLERDSIANFTEALLLPLFDEIGWEPRSDDDEQTPLLRSSLIAILGTIGRNESVRTRCHELFVEDHEGVAALDADLTTAVLTVVAQGAGETEFAMILDRFRAPRNPNDQLRHLNAFAQFAHPDLISRVHEMTLGEIRSQDAPYLLAAMLRNRAAGAATWRFITAHFEEMVERFPGNSIHRMLDGVSSLAQLDSTGAASLADEVLHFCDAHVTGARRSLVEQSLERLAINVGFATRLAAR